MTITTDTPEVTSISNSGAEQFSMTDLNGLTMEQLNAFVTGYAQRLLDFCSMVDQITDGTFAESNFPNHLRVLVPSLAIDLNFPLRVKPVSVLDMFSVSILLQLMERAAVRITDSLNASSDASAAEGQSAEETVEATSQEPV